MSKQIDLTTGHITDKLIKLAMPIMGVSFVQTAYNLIDMIWIGKAGSAHSRMHPRTGAQSICGG